MRRIRLGFAYQGDFNYVASREHSQKGLGNGNDQRLSHLGDCFLKGDFVAHYKVLIYEGIYTDMLGMYNGMNILLFCRNRLLAPLHLADHELDAVKPVCPHAKP
jgi:hypothetical protein